MVTTLHSHSLTGLVILQPKIFLLLIRILTHSVYYHDQGAVDVHEKSMASSQHVHVRYEVCNFTLSMPGSKSPMHETLWVRSRQMHEQP